MKALKEHWAALDPRLKQRGVLLLVAVAVLGLAWAFVGHDDRTAPSTPRETKRIAKEILTGRDAEGLGIEGVATDVAALTQAVQDLSAGLAHEKEAREQAEHALQTLTESTNETLTKQLSDAVDLIRTRERELARLRNDAQTSREADTSASPATPTLSNPVVEEEWDLFKGESPATPAAPVPPAGGARTHPGPPTQRSTPLAYQEYVEKSSETQPQAPADDVPFIPAGSIVSGTILTGLDAPTSKSTRQDPFPVLVRVKHAAILPNRFNLDVRECFIVGAGWGDLSSERAYIRAESLSCVRSDGEIIESRLDAYAVGEDSKAGIRGRLVSKQGQVLANAMLAGFASGISKAFQPQAIPVIGNTGEDRFSTPQASVALQSGALGGVSESMERLADFYIDLAEEMFPVIEVDAGRALTFIVNRGGRLELAKNEAKPAVRESAPHASDK